MSWSVLYSPALSASGSGDWALRSAGAFFKQPLATSAELSNFNFPDSANVPPSLDTSVAPFGQPASIQFTIDPNDGQDSGTLMMNAGVGQIQNSTVYYFSFRQRIPQLMANCLWPLTNYAAGIQGFKQMILGGFFPPGATHEPYTTVWENYLAHGFVGGYYYNTSGTQTGFDSYGAITSAFGADFHLQPGVDNSSVLVPDSLYPSVTSGAIDPDTLASYGSGFLWPWRQQRAQLGPLYSGNGQDSAFTFGLGDPYASGVRYPTDQFSTFTVRVDTGTMGSGTAPGNGSSRLTFGVAPEGGPYYLVADLQNVDLSPPTDGADLAMWLLPYVTNRAAGGVQVASRTNPIPGVTPLGVGLGCSTGNGTLHYTAANHQFTFKDATDSFGTPRGVAAYKQRIGVNGASAVGTYQGGRHLGIVVDYASLPGIDWDETVTIATGRPSMATHYAEALGSHLNVHATAFNSAGVQVGPTGGYAFPL